MYKIKVVKSTTVQVCSADCYSDCNSNKARGQAAELSKWRSQRTIPKKTKNYSYKHNDEVIIVKMKTFPWPQWTVTNEHIPLGLIHMRQEETHHRRSQAQVCQPSSVHSAWRPSAHTQPVHVACMLLYAQEYAQCHNCHSNFPCLQSLLITVL